MQPQKKLHSTKASLRVGLYSLVFLSKTSLFLVLFLTLSFLIQPVHKALANDALSEPEEDVVVADSVKIETVQEEQIETKTDAVEKTVQEVDIGSVKEQIDEVTVVVDEKAVEETSASASEVVPENVLSDEEMSDEVELLIEGYIDENIEVEEGNQSSSTTETINDLENKNEGMFATSTDISNSENHEDEATTSPEFIDHNASTTDESSEVSSVPVLSSGGGGGSGGSEGSSSDNNDSNESDSVSTSTPEVHSIIDSEIKSESVDVEEDVSEVGSSTEPVTENQVEARFLVTEQNYYQFSRQSCVAVGDGTYHCTLNSEPVIDTDTAVFADKDEGGDTEIYLQTKKGKVEKLTDNDFDDSSPYLDAESMRVVWQRSIDGRYQIFVYDLEEREEVQLTFSRTNNMEPKASKDGIVWQAWDGHDWEIMYFDGVFTDQITDNEAQDVAPVIEDEYIVWSILGSDTQEAKVYSLKSQEIMTISGHEGGAVANPRFVLVYDTKFENGDVITQGFDPATGLSAPISAKPASAPVDIPEVDTIGEIRALIQNKSSQKENQVKTVVGVDGDNTVDIFMTSSSSTSTGVTLDLSQSHPDQLDLGEVNLSEATTSLQTLELNDFDLVITPHGTTSLGKTDEPIFEVETETTLPATTTATTTQS